MHAAAVSPVLRAEVDEVWPRGGEITIRGSVVGGTPPEEHGDDATLIVRSRASRETELHIPVSWPGGARFEARIALEPLAIAHAGATAERTWDLYLTLRRHGEPLRLGTTLDDITGKKHIFTYPAQTVAGVRTEPYYTVKDNLSLSCRRDGTR